MSTDPGTFKWRLEAPEQLLQETKVTHSEVKKSITQAGTVSVILEYQIDVPYLPLEVHLKYMTVNMLNFNNYTDAMDTIVQLHSTDFDSDDS